MRLALATAAVMMLAAALAGSATVAAAGADGRARRDARAADGRASRDARAADGRARRDAPAHPVAGLVRDVPTGTRIRTSTTATTANLPYGGGPVLHSNRTHLIFWEPSGSGLAFDPSYVSLIETFLARVAADSHKTTNVYGLSGQYRDAQGPAAYATAYGGDVIDTDPLPPAPYACTEPATGPGWAVCLTDDQLQEEVDRVVDVDHLPQTGVDVYFLVTPEGLGSCLTAGPSNCALGGSGSGYCGYHSQTAQGVLYAVIPYNAVPAHCQSGNPRPNGNAADPAISTVSHEHNEMVTDPDGNAWVDAGGNEVGDLCITSFGGTLGATDAGAFNEVIDGGHYYLQEEWSNENRGCRPRARPDHVSVTLPVHPQARAQLQFGAHASDPDGSIIRYNWSFGDGGTGRGRVATHSYKRPGTYRVQVRTTDSADNWAFDTISVVVSKAAAQDRRTAGRHARGR